MNWQIIEIFEHSTKKEVKKWIHSVKLLMDKDNQI